MFKSYYVVWKRFVAKNPKIIGATVFKSYYVVWKLKNPKIIEKIMKSLNRTMQYGNQIWVG